jgi:hypothetical protein
MATWYIQKRKIKSLLVVTMRQITEEKQLPRETTSEFAI